MNDYTFRGVDRIGKPINGTFQASSILALENKLAESGGVLIEAFIKGEEETGRFNASLFKPKIKNREMIDFFLTLKGMLKAGVTLLESLRTIGKEVDNPFFRKTINEIISSVEAGKLFSDSLAGYKRIFSDHVIGMIKAGECGGTLPETFGELVRYLEWQESIKADVRQATFYPVTVLIALLGFITVLFTFVVPRFIKLLTSLKVALPFPTRLVMSTSNFFVATWWIWLFAGVFFPIAIKFARKKWEWFALAFDKFKLNIVIFGELNRMLVISRFAHNFAALFKSGVPVLQNLELCQGLVGSKVLEKALGDTKGDIEGGMPLHESLRKHDVFPAKALMMISVGETSGDLGGALDNVASYYNEEIPRRIKKVFAVMEPLIMLFLISIVGFSAVAIILPILSLFGNIK